MRLLILMTAQAATLAATQHTVDAPMQAPSKAPSGAAEFDGARVDPAPRRVDTAVNTPGWFNHELQYYADARPENTRIEQGALVIEARHETLPKAHDWAGQAYTSGKLVTRQAYGYGFYEVRAKLPCARGTWPAIWLLPTGDAWPDEGEIDVMEMVGWQPGVVHATLHSGAFNHRLGTQRGAETMVATSCSEFHRYQLDWGVDTITIGVDGHAYMRVKNDQPGGKPAWPFTRPYNLILNLAVGGDWGGAKGVDDAALPQQMAVDYVRYWQKPSRQ